MMRSIFVFFFVFPLSFLLIAQNENSEQYQETIKMGDSYYASGDYINAKSSYQYAARMDPEAEYPKEQLQKTLSKLREKMALMDDYTAVITEADNLYRKKEYDLAIAKYQEAAMIIPSEGYPEQKIEEIRSAKDDTRKMKIAYDDAIYRAEKYVKYRKYEEAIEYFQKASEFLPDESYPEEQIALIESEMKDLVEARNEYASLIQNADRLLSLKYYEQAKAEYLRAVEVRPEDSYPQSQIQEVDKLLVQKSEFDRYVEMGDEQYMNKSLQQAKTNYQNALSIYPAENYPRDMINKINEALKDQVDRDDLYTTAIQSADAFFAAADYANARQEYQNASDLKSRETYPQMKIKEIDDILLAQAANEEAYDQAVKMGDQYLNTGAYAEAKNEFEKALALKSGATYAAEKLAEAERQIAEQEAILASYQQSIDKADGLFNSGDFAAAKKEYQNALIIVPEDTYATGRISEIEELQAAAAEGALAYSKLVSEADALFNENDLVAARSKYQMAMDLDDSQDYPQARISEINQILQQQQQRNTDYNKAIATGDIYFNNKEYDQAQSEYEKAAILKPNASYPQNKLAEIATLTTAAASTTAAIVPAGNNQGDGYQDAIKEADGLLGLQEYAKARLLYVKASNLRPKEQYPKTKIEEIDKVLSEQESNEAEYNRLIAAGDRMLESGDLKTASERYNMALLIKPGEQYPKQQLEEIDKRFLALEIETQNAYNETIEEADQLFNQKSYPEARLKYEAALKYKPDEGYPKQKLTEIEQLTSDQKKLEDQYSRLVHEADNLFTSRQYQEAKAKYAEASALFPEEEHPRTRIEEINLIIRAGNQENQQAYDKMISDADKFFSSGAYGKAMEAYRKAGAMMPDESYPEEMVDKIMKILNDNAFRKLVTSSKSIQNNETEKLSFDPISVTDRKSSILIIRARGMGIRDFKVFVSYGKGGSKNGGFIMPIPGGGDMKEYVFEIGNQYTWFSEDNNWISLTPQGGSIEISVVEIAKAGGGE